MKKIKEILYKKCQDYVTAKIVDAQNAIDEAQKAANNETKSSAGDKYETGRAMMHLEKEKHARRLSEALQTKQALDQIDIDKNSENIQTGSLVQTNQGNFFLSISAGKIKAEGKSYFAISLASPIGKILFNHKKGDQVIFRNKTFKIITIS